jgi:hypothetical protein
MAAGPQVRVSKGPCTLYEYPRPEEPCPGSFGAITCSIYRGIASQEWQIITHQKFKKKEPFFPVKLKIQMKPDENQRLVVEQIAHTAFWIFEEADATYADMRDFVKDCTGFTMENKGLTNAVFTRYQELVSELGMAMVKKMVGR